MLLFPAGRNQGLERTLVCCDTGIGALVLFWYFYRNLWAQVDSDISDPPAEFSTPLGCLELELTLFSAMEGTQDDARKQIPD